MGYEPRRLEKFENSGGTTTVTFPLNEFEWQSEQALRVPVAAIPGGHYGYDLIGSGPAIKEPAHEMLRTLIIKPAGTPSDVDTDVDELLSELWSIGLGKLYTIDRNSVRRWAWARVTSMPSMQWSAGMIFSKSIGFDFLRLSDWYSTTETDITETVNNATYNFNVTNSGNAPVYNAVLILKGQPFTNPQLTNNTNGYVFATTRDATLTTQWLKVDAGAHTVGWSTNSGSSYADDYALYTRPTGQVQLMRFEPGVNSMTLTGANGSTLDVNFYPAYH
jgi:hypothetical protein